LLFDKGLNVNLDEKLEQSSKEKTFLLTGILLIIFSQNLNIFLIHLFVSDLFYLERN